MIENKFMLKDANQYFRDKNYRAAYEIYNRLLNIPQFTKICKFNMALCIRRDKNLITSMSKNKISKHIVVNKNMIRGWCAVLDINQPIKLSFMIGTTIIGSLVADLFRKDLVGKVNNGFHAFNFVIPHKYYDGKSHKIDVVDNDTLTVIESIDFKFVSEKRRYDDLESFLSSSFTQVKYDAPFNEVDKRCFASMENIAKYLCNQAKKLIDKPLVSIVMPVYNREGIVDVAIKSVLAQTYENLELIVVDDFSQDNTKIALQQYINHPKINIIRNDCNLGVSKSRNIALKNANGQYIMYLDSDNTWDKRYVSAMVGAFALLNEPDALYSGQLLFYGNECTPRTIRFASYNKSLLRNRNYIDMNAFCHTKSCTDRIGGFDINLKRLVDYDLILRISKSCIMYSVPVLLSNYYYDKVDNTITNDKTLSLTIDEVRKKHDINTGKYVDIISIGYRIDYPLQLTKKVSIVIPSYGVIEDIQECLDSIFDLNIGSNLEVIVVDNNSSIDVIKYLEKLKLQNKIKLILNNQNYGFTYAVMQGISIAIDSSDIILLNNDAVVTKNSLEVLQYKAYTISNCGLVVPQQVLLGNTKTIDTHVPFANKNVECDVNLSIHHNNIINPPLFHNGCDVEISFAPFFCVYIRRDILDDSIGLDAEFGRHYRSDRIYCNFVRKVLNKKIFHVHDSIVYHKLQRATDGLKNSGNREIVDYDLMFVKNQWDEQSKKNFNFGTANWDL